MDQIKFVLREIYNHQRNLTYIKKVETDYGLKQTVKLATHETFLNVYIVHNNEPSTLHSKI